VNRTGTASGAAAARDGGTCQTYQTQTGTRVAESHLTTFVARKTAVHGQSN